MHKIYDVENKYRNTTSLINLYCKQVKVKHDSLKTYILPKLFVKKIKIWKEDSILAETLRVNS